MRGRPAKRLLVLGCALVLGAALGCASANRSAEPIASAEMAPAPMVQRDADGAARQRKLVRSGDLHVRVAAPEEALAEVERIVSEAGGFVENATVDAEASVFLGSRVPAASLDTTMDAIAALGDTESRSVSAHDVSERVADLETRLRTQQALRTRLQELLARAQDVEDVLAIEKELGRIQIEIERMQAQVDRLDRDVALSRLSVHLERRRILGPLGYLGYGVWWLVSKLFVLH